MKYCVECNSDSFQKKHKTYSKPTTTIQATAKNYSVEDTRKKRSSDKGEFKSNGSIINVDIDRTIVDIEEGKEEEREEEEEEEESEDIVSKHSLSSGYDSYSFSESSDSDSESDYQDTNEDESIPDNSIVEETESEAATIEEENREQYENFNGNKYSL